MSAQRSRIEPFRVTAINGRDVLQFGPRYPDSYASRELFMRVYHRTTGGDVSVLVTPEQVGVLARWFLGEQPVIHASGGHPPLGEKPDGSFQEPTLYFREFTVIRETFVLRDLQTTATGTALPNGGCSVGIVWNGSHSGRAAVLAAEDRRAVAGFLTKFERDGWTERS